MSAGPRQWVGRAQFPERDPFYVGTVEAVTLEQAVCALEALCDRHFPTRPVIVDAVPGAIILQLEDAA